jgi:hypothetical protein
VGAGSLAQALFAVLHEKLFFESPSSDEQLATSADVSRTSPSPILFNFDFNICSSFERGT